MKASPLILMLELYVPNSKVLIKRLNLFTHEKFRSTGNGLYLAIFSFSRLLEVHFAKPSSTPHLSPNIILSFFGDYEKKDQRSLIKYLRAYLRLFVFGVSISLGMGYILLVTLLRGKNLMRSMQIRRSWIKFISPVLGLKIVNRTRPESGHYLFIGNHRSFMDPVVILHHIYALPLAKSEVKSYPLIGYGAGITGVLYVVRDSVHSRLDARQAIANMLKEGKNVLVYPEGTTYNTPLSGPFKKGSFEIAAVLDVPVVPVAIEYRDVNDHWKEKSLFQQYLYQFGKRECICRIEYGKPIVSDEPAKLLSDTQEWIDEQLKQFRKEFDAI